MLREKRLPQNVARYCRQLLFLLLNSSDLDFSFARDRFFRHGRVEQNVREQVHAQFQIGFGDVDRDTQAIVASVTRNRAADRFDLVCNLFRGARFGSFQQHLRHQTGDPVGLRGLCEKTAPKNGAYGDQRQTRIFAH